jgi:EAL domain-containing protein (putative c-di-GMP-specific phosphodiesterase class I)
MHHAEIEGRNRVVRFAPSMQQMAQLRQALECDLRAAMGLQQIELRRALVSQQFEVHYQPQVSLVSGELIGFESLVRWRHPDRGLVSPAEFIPLAEEIGLIDLLGDWVLRTACREAMTWPSSPNGKQLRVAVNVSPLQLRDGRAFIAGVVRALEESGLPPERLEIEITETSLMGDVADTLGALRRLGVDLALDDFGTGHSSLGRLHQYPFSRIKIDRSFVLALGDDDPSGRRVGEWMIRAIAALGAGLGIETIVEGIETVPQREIARQAGCTEMQGYLVSRPMPAGAVQSFIETFNESPTQSSTNEATHDRA